jgi:hypothetical protein
MNIQALSLLDVGNGNLDTYFHFNIQNFVRKLLCLTFYPGEDEGKKASIIFGKKRTEIKF